MAINLELPKKLHTTIDQAHQAAAEIFRPVSRKYDLAEHAYPSSSTPSPASTTVSPRPVRPAPAPTVAAARPPRSRRPKAEVVNGGNMQSVLNVMETSWGDVGLMLSMPYQGLGNSAIAAVATDEQLKRFGKVWAAMAITEPGFGSDSAAVTTTATLDGDEYVINGEKIFVTSGSRATHIVVWATVDKSLGRAAIKSFVVPREHPGVEVARLEHKLGIKASDTAVIRFENCRIPKDNLLGSPEVDVKEGLRRGHADLRQHPPAGGRHGRRSGARRLEELRGILEDAGVEIDYDRPAADQHAAAAEFIRMEADFEAAYLMTMRATWMADNKMPNSTEASMSKAKAGRTVTDITNKTVELTGTLGYSERLLIEKWARDSKILDIFEGTQQIQNLIIARRVLGKSSAELWAI